MASVIGQYDSEEGIQIVGHDDEIGASFIRPKAMYSELVHREIILNLLYSVLRVCPASIHVVDDLHGQLHIGNETTIAVITKIFHVREQAQLVDSLSCRLRSFIDLLTNHHDASLLLPIKTLVGAFSNV